MWFIISWYNSKSQFWLVCLGHDQQFWPSSWSSFVPGRTLQAEPPSETACWLSSHRYEPSSPLWVPHQWLHNCKCCRTTIWTCRPSSVDSLAVPEWPEPHRACSCTACCDSEGTTIQLAPGGVTMEMMGKGREAQKVPPCSQHLVAWLGRWWGRGESNFTSGGSPGVGWVLVWEVTYELDWLWVLATAQLRREHVLCWNGCSKV